MTWDLLAERPAGPRRRWSSRWPTRRTCGEPCCSPCSWGSSEMPTVLALNMSDEAEARGLRIDVEALSRALGRARAVDGGDARGRDRARCGPRSREACPPTNHLPLPEDIAPLVARDLRRQGAAARPGGAAALRRPLPRGAAGPRGRPGRRGSAAGLRRGPASRPRSRLRAPAGEAVRPPGLGLAAPAPGPLRRLPRGRALRGGHARRSARGRAVRPVSQPIGQGRLRPPAELASSRTSSSGSTASSPWA